MKKKKHKQYIVIGMGRFGQSVAKTLYNLGKDVLAVDSDEDIIENISPFVTHAVKTNAMDEKSLAALGIGNFDVAVVTMGTDIQSSILITMLCKEMGVGYVVAKAQNELHGKVLERTGADRVVFPERDMGMRVAHNLAASNVLDYIEIMGDLRMVDIAASEIWIGQSLADLNFRQKYSVNVIAIKKKNSPVNPSPHGADVIEQGDALVVIGDKKSIAKLEAKNGML